MVRKTGSTREQRHRCYSKDISFKGFTAPMTKGLYNILLEQSVLFKDKDYNNLEDFYLMQRYPDEIISGP